MGNLKNSYISHSKGIQQITYPSNKRFFLQNGKSFETFLCALAACPANGGMKHFYNNSRAL
jgi:hypothetical protein